MSRQEKEDQNVSRRRFLKAAALTAAAATATGTGAALLTSPGQPSLPAAAPNLQPPLMPAAAANGADTELFAQLVSAQAENIRLQTKLDAAQRRLQAEESDNGQFQVLRAELDSSSQQLSVMSGLLALYQQLDEVDFGELLDQGLISVSTHLNELIAELPTLAEGIEVGRQALDELDDHIPLLQNGRLWLDEQATKLGGYFTLIELLLGAAVESSGPFLQMLNDWFKSVLKWLPFGIGQRASEIMQASADLLTETPHTIAGMNSQIAHPLDTLLLGETEEPPIRENLVKPLRDKVLKSAGQTVVQTQNLQTAYQEKLSQPASAAISSQRAIRSTIEAYRQRHQI